jgi:hypothetical protein
MRVFSVCVSLLAAFFITACWDIVPSDRNSFNRDLWGTWVSNDPSVYSGELVIDIDRITITGYTEGQTPLTGDDNRRPFRGFTKGMPLKGYSEEGKIFIEDGGLLQEGIPYTYWEDSPPPNYRKVRYLRFTFGGRSETLQCQ